jgi:ubiquinone/menaquinone biosynthesis C-methylase UbiE
MQQLSRFENVDAASDPRAFVRYLDSVTALDAARAYKHQSFGRLGLQTGSAVLDVGCGSGEDLRSLADIVGPTGRVVGVDSSAEMVAQARDRTRGLPVAVQVDNAQQLNFPDDTFDASRCDRVFQHLSDPAKALREMIRVTRPGGRVSVVDTDWGTLVVAAEDRLLARKIAAFQCDRQIRNGWIGRELLGLARTCGLEELTTDAATATITDLPLALKLLHLATAADEAAAAGAISSAERADWTAQLERAAADGSFFSALTVFGVSGRTP